MYTFDTPISQVSGVGQTLAEKLKHHDITTIKDFLVFAPLRYLDATNFKTIKEVKNLEESELVSVKAKVVQTSQFRKGPRTIQTVLVKDETDSLKLMFFNSNFVLTSLKKDNQYVFSGKYSPKYKNLTQPKFEIVKKEQLHTGRLVPYYSSRLHIAQGTIRRLLKNILDNLDTQPDIITPFLAKTDKPTTNTLNQIFAKLHFPQKPAEVMQARQRLTLEEILSLIDFSQAAKNYLKHQQNASIITQKPDQALKKLPFSLSSEQTQALNEILTDLEKPYPMNRLLMGDVGTGKTVVAGLAASAVVASGYHVALIAPTTILAKQHQASLKKLLSNTKIKLVTAVSKLKLTDTNTPTLFIGTHALINKLNQVNPALIIYDEQQKFGVWQRGSQTKQFYPHVLNMTATPIPRTLMLTVFSHVALSTIKTHPKPKQPVTTWVVEKNKRLDAFLWLKKRFKKQPQSLMLVVAPFIDPSYHQALENIKAVTEIFHEYQTFFKTQNVAMLHGRMTKAKQNQVIDELKTGKINLLVATPMIEVGVDLPQADVMVIESAERFGLSSLHQLRGRVGRSGQEAFCLLFSQASEEKNLTKLKQFSKLHDGEKIAELDLKYRGSGDIFGTKQHGISNLKFASWLTPDLIKKARKIYSNLPKSWESFLTPQVKINLNQLN